MCQLRTVQEGETIYKHFENKQSPFHRLSPLWWVMLTSAILNVNVAHKERTHKAWKSNVVSWRSSHRACRHPSSIKSLHWYERGGKHMLSHRRTNWKDTPLYHTYIISPKQTAQDISSYQIHRLFVVPHTLVNPSLLFPLPGMIIMISASTNIRMLYWNLIIPPIIRNY